MAGKRKVPNREGHLSGICGAEALHDRVEGTTGLALEVEELDYRHRVFSRVLQDVAVLRQRRGGGRRRNRAWLLVLRYGHENERDHRDHDHAPPR